MTEQTPKDADNPLTRRAHLRIRDWAGYHEVPVEVVGETSKRWRVIFKPGTVFRGRKMMVGEAVLVPKWAVKFL